MVHDRDINAVRNIFIVAKRHFETIDACVAPNGAMNQEGGSLGC
jgi:hypothetical protein